MNRLLLFLSLLPFVLPAAAEAISHPPELEANPVALGAWLYEGQCRRCHGPYREAALASSFASAEEVAAAMGRQGCADQGADRLRRSEVEAVVRFMLAWEREGALPQLPDLPPSTAGAKTVLPLAKPTSGYVLKPEKAKELPPPLADLIKNNEVARGGWSYTTHCHRCHRDYGRGRMARGLSRDTLQRVIENGKTSTQMTPFSRIRGGPLSLPDIRALVAYILTWEDLEEAPAIAGALMTPPAVDPADLLPIGAPNFPRVSGDGDRGHILILMHCTRCHGLAAEGGIGPSLQRAPFSTRPDLFLKSLLKQGIPGSPMPSWSQDRGGPLSAVDINNLVTRLLRSFTIADNESAPD